jgi:hypothetical protein
MAERTGQRSHRASNRLITCLLPSCARLFSACGGCDRGRRYCSGECARTARRVQQRRAGRIYQATDRGRLAHAVRQARYRARFGRSDASSSLERAESSENRTCSSGTGARHRGAPGGARTIDAHRLRPEGSWRAQPPALRGVRTADDVSSLVLSGGHAFATTPQTRPSSRSCSPRISRRHSRPCRPTYARQRTCAPGRRDLGQRTAGDMLITRLEPRPGCSIFCGFTCSTTARSSSSRSSPSATRLGGADLNDRSSMS